MYKTQKLKSPNFINFIGLNKVTFLAIWARFFSSDMLGFIYNDYQFITKPNLAKPNLQRSIFKCF